MKKFEVDCNFNYLGPTNPSLTHKEVKDLNLKENEQVIVFQDNDEWKGTVKYNDSLPTAYQWYVELFNHM